MPCTIISSGASPKSTKRSSTSTKNVSPFPHLPVRGHCGGTDETADLQSIFIAHRAAEEGGALVHSRQAKPQPRPGWPHPARGTKFVEIFVRRNLFRPALVYSSSDSLPLTEDCIHFNSFLPSESRMRMAALSHECNAGPASLLLLLRRVQPAPRESGFTAVRPRHMQPPRQSWRLSNMRLQNRLETIYLPPCEQTFPLSLTDPHEFHSHMQSYHLRR